MERLRYYQCYISYILDPFQNVILTTTSACAYKMWEMFTHYYFIVYTKIAPKILRIQWC